MFLYHCYYYACLYLIICEISLYLLPFLSHTAILYYFYSHYKTHSPDKTLDVTYIYMKLKIKLRTNP